MSLPKHMQSIVLRKVGNDFIKFLIECIVNLVEGNFRNAKKDQFIPHRKLLQYIMKSYKSHAKKNIRSKLTSEQGLRLVKTIYPLIYAKFNGRRVGSI